MESDSDRFVRGRGRYVDDLRLEGMLHLKVARSPYARARVLSVKGGFTGSDFPANLVSVGEGAWGGSVATVPYPALATSRVNYVGQPVAAVLAENEYRAEDRLSGVDVAYEPLKPVVDPQVALHAEPIHEDLKSNVASHVEMGQDFTLDAPVVVDDELVNERISPNPLEPRGIVAHYDGSKLTVWASTQSVHTWKEGLCSATKLPREKVRVVAMDTGGAFGSKSAVYPEYVVACLASMRTGKPVKWIETRSEHLVATSQGRGARAHMTLFADRTGKVLGLKAEVLVDNGAYAVGIGAAAPRFIGMQLTGPYAIAKAFVKGTSVYTNKVPLGPYRGAGRPEAAFFIERMMDLLADELRLDPLELRLRNASPDPFVSPLGLKLEPFEPFLRSAAKELGYAEIKANEPAGFSSFVLMTAVQPGESARIHVKDGEVRAWMGTSRGGQGHETVAQEILGEELGIPKSAIRLEMSDTEQLDQGIGTWGSRTAAVGGAALIEAASKLKERLIEEMGAYAPGELLKRDLDVTVFHRESEQANTFGACFARVAWDRETGQASVSECTCYFDIGRVLNRPMVDSQSIGGATQGIGQVLSEEVVYTEDGQPLVASLADAGVLSAPMTPAITIKLARPPASSRGRIKGVGEAATTGVPPAVLRALEKALGRRLRRTPVRPEGLLPG
jgi:carbon-monoxide dehydrogenase large subunit